MASKSWEGQDGREITMTRTPGSSRPSHGQPSVSTSAEDISPGVRLLRNDAWGVRVLDLLEAIQAGLDKAEPAKKSADQITEHGSTQLAS